MVNSSSEDDESMSIPRQTRPACSGLVQVSLMIVVVATFKCRRDMSWMSTYKQESFPIRLQAGELPYSLTLEFGLC
jgi:hypothetical protein